jgi:hypothetical protein
MFYRKGQQFMKRHQTSIANFNLGIYLKNVTIKQFPFRPFFYILIELISHFEGPLNIIPSVVPIVPVVSEKMIKM